MVNTALDWVRDGFFYQIFPDRFAKSSRFPATLNLEPWDAPPTLHGFKGGDLWGVAENLDLLSELGVTGLYLNPIFASTANHRYHTHDYFKVDPLLGGDDALRYLLNEAHSRGMKVILDGVFNHASRGFFQFNHTLENGRYSPYVDWFHFNKKWLAEDRPISAYAAEPLRFQPPDSEKSMEMYGYRAWWDIPSLPKFNTSHPAVRDYLFSVASYWIQFGIDGWRLDVPSEIDDDMFWREFRRRVKSLRPDAYIVGEIWHDATRWLQGDQFDGVTNYLLGKSLLGFFADESLNRESMERCGLADTRPLTAEACAEALDDVTHRYSRNAVECQLNVVGSHDTPRLLTMVSGDDSSVRLIMNGMFTLPGAPCLYYGDEIGMAGGHDPDCRRGFEWDHNLWNIPLRQHIQKLAAIRKEHEALRRGDIQFVYAEGGALAYVRRTQDHWALVCHNRANDIKKLDLSSLNRPPRSLMSLLDGELKPDGSVILPPRSSGIWVA